MDDLANIWNMIAPYVTNGAIWGAIASILGACISRAIKNSRDKTTVNLEVLQKNLYKEIDDRVTKFEEKLKTVTIEQDITPLVKSELKKVTEEANEYVKQQLKETQEGYDKLLNCLEKLSAYFDNSIGVSDEAKTELKQAIEEAKVPAEPVNTFETKVVVEEQPKEIVIEKKTSKKKSAEIER